MARVFSILALVLFSGGCCVGFSSKVRNETGKDLLLTAVRPSQKAESVAIRAGSARRLGGVMPRFDGCDSWIISDGQSRFIFSDVSPIATMRGASVSSTRFSKIFPCRRFTQHVRIETNMMIYAVGYLGQKISQPPGFPIQFTKREDEK